MSRTFWCPNPPLAQRICQGPCTLHLLLPTFFFHSLAHCRSNKAVHHQAARFGGYFHTSELPSPTGCWKRAKERHLACHISSLATASQEEGLKLNETVNKIQPSDPCHCVSPTAQSALPTQPQTYDQADGNPSRSLWFCQQGTQLIFGPSENFIHRSPEKEPLGYQVFCSISAILRARDAFYHSPQISRRHLKLWMFQVLNIFWLLIKF